MVLFITIYSIILFNETPMIKNNNSDLKTVTINVLANELMIEYSKLQIIYRKR